MVNRLQGDPGQLRERHDASDFDKAAAPKAAD
jgi:hypothetical protein